MSNIAETAFFIDTAGILETSGIEFERMGGEWIEEAVEHALAISEDVPTIKEALNGDEKADWSSAIDTELNQIEKLGT